MIFGIYAVQDLKSTFMTPTIDQNDATAKRNFEHAIMAGNNVFFTHPQDFRLMKLAEYDNENGRITRYDIPELVCDGKDVGL
jgi:hypothetical protein